MIQPIALFLFFIVSFVLFGFLSVWVYQKYFPRILRLAEKIIGKPFEFKTADGQIITGVDNFLENCGK